MAEKYPKLEKETDIQVQKAQRILNKLKTKRSTSKPIIIKMSKVKASEKQHAIYKGILIRSWADFSAEILQDKREWQDIFKG